jgi:hypothetical protein
VIVVTHSIEAVPLRPGVLLAPRLGLAVLHPAIEREGGRRRYPRDKHYLDAVDEIWRILKRVRPLSDTAAGGGSLAVWCVA